MLVLIKPYINIRSPFSCQFQTLRSNIRVQILGGSKFHSFPLLGLDMFKSLSLRVSLGVVGISCKSFGDYHSTQMLRSKFSRCQLNKCSEKRLAPIVITLSWLYIFPTQSYLWPKNISRISQLFILKVSGWQWLSLLEERGHLYSRSTQEICWRWGGGGCSIWRANTLHDLKWCAIFL